MEEKEKPDSAAKTPNRTNRFRIIGIYILAALLGIFVSKLFFGVINVRKPAAHKAPSSPNQPVPVSKTTPLAQPLPSSPLPENPISSSSPAKTGALTPEVFVLNGIFYAKNGCYALINNRIVKEGDTVEGANVTRISDEGVSLEAEGSKVFLSSTKIK